MNIEQAEQTYERYLAENFLFEDFRPQIRPVVGGRTECTLAGAMITGHLSPVRDESPAAQARDLLSALWPTERLQHQLRAQDRETGMFGTFPVQNVAEAVESVASLSNEGSDCYFACAEYRNAETPGTAQVASASAFWLSIPCGEGLASSGQGYEDWQLAASALADFCSLTDLPFPTHAVTSDSGLQVYWVLDAPLTPQVWSAYAGKLKSLTEDLGLAVDPSRTADIESELRVPGTMNYNYVPAELSYLQTAYEARPQQSVLEDIDRAYAQRQKLAETPATPPDPLTGLSFTAHGSLYLTLDLKRLQSALAVLDPECGESTWVLQRLAPLANAAGQYPEAADQVRTLARRWSSGELAGRPSRAWCTPGSTGLTGEQLFDGEWQRLAQAVVIGERVTLKTIFHDAENAGWVYRPFDAEPDPVVGVEPHAAAMAQRTVDEVIQKAKGEALTVR